MVRDARSPASSSHISNKWHNKKERERNLSEDVEIVRLHRLGSRVLRIKIIARKDANTVGKEY